MMRSSLPLRSWLATAAGRFTPIATTCAVSSSGPPTTTSVCGRNPSAHRAFDVDGKPVFVGLAAAASESTDAWDDFIADLKARSLRPPLLGISDGGPGLIAACELLQFRTSLRQRCLVHRARSTFAKVSVHDQAEVKADLWATFDVGDAAAGGDEAIAVANRQAAALAAKWKASYPAAVACVTDDLSLTVHLRIPAEHGKRIRHSNFIERTFGETRRRVKVIGRLPGESTCVPLLWAVHDRASRGRCGLTMSPKALRLLQDLRRQLLEPPVELGARRSGRRAGISAGSEALTA